MRTMILGAAGLAISIPGVLAFSASTVTISLRSPTSLPLRTNARKAPLSIQASLR